MEWLRLDEGAPDPGVIGRAAEVLRAGGLVIFPTDTLYGLAADPRVPAGVARVFEAKGRPSGRPLPLVAADLDQVSAGVIVMSPVGRRLAERFWPGPLTIVGEARPGVAAGVDGGTGTLAVRVPAHRVARDLASALGFAIVSTSANPSGALAPQTARESAAGLAGRVALVLDAGPAPGGEPSTIVDARTDPPRLVRAGAVPFDAVLGALVNA